MNEEQTSEIQQCLDRLHAGDQEAADEMVILALGSLHEKASAILRKQFGRLNGHETGDVFNSAWPQLVREIKARPPKSIDELLKIACRIMRNDLIDLVRRERAPFRNALPFDTSVEQPSATPSPEELERWAEFHKNVSQLPDELRTVFEFKYYLDMTQADISRLRNIHPREVGRRYGRAVQLLTKWMSEAGSSTDLA
jgi:RNA polymerase sigma factor (sigma-70 family)